MVEFLIYMAVGLAVGALSGLLGVGGGILLIPMLVIIFGFTQHQAQGTSLAMMLPPVGFFAVMEYYKAGNVNIKAAIALALTFAIGAWIMSRFAVKIPQDLLRRIFAVFLLFVSGYFLFSSRAGGPMTAWAAGGTGAFALGGWLRSRQRSAGKKS